LLTDTTIASGDTPTTHSRSSRASGDSVNINVLLAQIKSLTLNSGTHDSRAAAVLLGLNFHTLRSFHSYNQDKLEQINRSGGKAFGQYKRQFEG